MFKALKEKGVWEDTFIITTADHGMGMTAESLHDASTPSSWGILMNFYGSGIKKGSTIPYAESPDIAIMINHLLNLKPLQGHLDTKVNEKIKAVTGTLLKNIFIGKPDELAHPKFISRYLKSKQGSLSDYFDEYRSAMLSYIKDDIVKY